MLRVRIKYNKISDTIQETSDFFVCGKRICKGYYDKTNHSWKIINLINNKMLYEGICKKESEAKVMIKKHLKILGANFIDEVKSTKTNKTPMLTVEVINEILKEKEGK